MTDYKKFKTIIDEIPVLISSNVSSSDSIFQAWYAKAERFLINRYGKGSYEHTKFTNTRFSLGFFVLNTPKSEFVTACKSGLETTQIIFQDYLNEMLEEDKNNERNDSVAQHYEYSRVFIVHGHNGELKQSVARIIEKQGIDVILLSEQANQGKTIIEKFESNSNVGGVICLFTVDDIVKNKNEDSPKARARQNVVFETGFFMGKFGRNHIVLLADNEVEMPSDLSGVVYTDTSNWHIELLKELKAMGYSIDFNKIF